MKGYLSIFLLLSVLNLPSRAFLFHSVRSRNRNLVTISLKATAITTVTTIDKTIDTSETSTEAASSSSIRQGSLTFYQETRSVGKPPLLYLPGLDGKGSYSSTSLQNLTNHFDVWRLSIDVDDRSRFVDIAVKCRDFIKTFKVAPVLVGESFGGLLACYVSIISTIKPSKLVIVNPATSFERTAWSTVAPLIANTGDAFPLVGGFTLLATAVEVEQFQRLGRPIMERINSTETALLELNNMFAMSKLITDILPPETLNWRVSKWLATGSSLMSNKYSAITTPTVVIVGQNDRLLPSQSEGRRLQKAINSTTVEVLEFQDTGHAIFDGSLDLASILLNSRTFQPPKVKTVEVAYPSDDAIASIEKQIGPFIKSFSPIFLSRVPDMDKMKPSRVARGVNTVPVGLQGRPVLFVGNHQLYGADLSMIILEFLKVRQTLVRGLAHPAIMGSSDMGSIRVILDRTGQPVGTSSSRSSANGIKSSNSSSSSNSNNGMMMNTDTQFVSRDEQGIKDIFSRFGAVEVTPANYYELLRRNETILLFPGGAKEAYHRKGEENALLWPEKTDFIRMAATFDAIVVPFAAIGMADSVEMLLDRDDLIQLPYFGKRVLEASLKIPQARPGGDEQFIAPISVPKLPSRNYFVFEEPFDTRSLSSSNKTACKEAYQEVKSRVQSGIDFLKDFRARDKYREFLPRALYEIINGKQAPTTPLNL